MKSNNLIKFFVSLVASMVCFTVQATSLDVRGEYENWNSGLGGTSTALLGGVGASHTIMPRLSIGGGFVFGNYSNTADSDTDISRMDLDITASYLVRPLISVYGGYQMIRLSYANKDDATRSFDDTLHGLGAGVVSYLPLKPKWLVYGGLGFSGVYASSSVKGGSSDRGKGYSNSMNAGVLYAISKKMSVASGVKMRWTSVDYGDGSGSWAHNASRFVVSLSRQL